MKKISNHSMIMIILGLFLLLFMAISFGITYQTKNTAQAENEKTEKIELFEKSELQQYVQLAKNIVRQEEPLILELYNNKKGYNYNLDGITVLNENRSEETVQIEMITNEKEGEIEIILNNEDGTTTRSSVFTYVEHDMIFTSAFSIEEARFNAVQYKYEIGEISPKDYQNENAIFSRRGIKDTVSIQSAKNTSVDKTTYVTGQLQWTTKDGDIKPLSYMRVDLFDYDPLGSDELLGITYTDLYGNFSFAFQNDDSIAELNGYDVYIRMYPDGRTFEIGKNWDTTHYYYFCDSPKVDNVSNGSTTTFDRIILFDPNNNHNNAFYIAQGLVVGEKYVRDMMGHYPSDVVKIWFPLLPPEINRFITWVNNTFNASISTIDEPQTAFCYGTNMGISSHYMYNWDTILHEYGHFIEHQMDTYDIDILQHLIYNPSHSFNEDDVDAHTLLWNLTDITCKEYGLKLAWTEAWASAFSLISQDYYNKKVLNISTIQGVADTFYNTYNCETVNGVLVNGEANEWAITAFLWDLYDSNSNDDDLIKMGASRWWEVTTISGTYMLSDLAHILDNEYGIYRKGIGELMELYGFGVKLEELTGVTNGQILSDTTTITIKWLPCGRPTAPNNQFTIGVYDNKGKELWMSDKITSSSYTISATELSAIRSLIGRNATTFNVAVLGYNTDTPGTGLYQSKVFSVNVKNPIEIISERYSEFIGSSLLGAWVNYYVRFNNSGMKIIQTFGTKDTKMEIYDANDTLIDRDSDSGYDKNALISLNATAKEVYRISIRFKSVLTSGSFKLAIIPAAAVSNYETINTLSPSIPSITVNAPANMSSIFTYKSQTTSSHRIFTAKSSSSSIFTNTVLYIVDPRSTEKGYLYDNDGGDGLYSSITHTFDEGIPYLIVASKLILSRDRTFLLCNE